MNMKLLVLLSLTTVVCGMFDITFPEGIQLNFTAQQYNCLYDPNAKVYPWNPNGSPLGLKLYIDKTMIDIYYCKGEDYQDYTDWTYCNLIQLYVQPLAGNVCIKNVTAADQLITMSPGINGTLRILYTENGNGASLQCIPVTISKDGPEWDGSNCENDENTGFQPFEEEYEALYGGVYIPLSIVDGMTGEYETYTVKDGRTSAIYNYYYTSGDKTETIDLDKVTKSTESATVFITFTSDGTKILYNGGESVFDWTSTGSVDAATFTAASGLKTSAKSSGSKSETDLGSAVTLSGLMVFVALVVGLLL